VKAWRRTLGGVAAVLIAAAGLGLCADAPQQSLDAIHSALYAGEADRALSLLRSFEQAGTEPAEALNLECRVRLTLRQWDPALQACEQAVRLDPQNPSYHSWLGRALGKKAEKASFISAISLGKRVRTEFEEAVRLSPRSADTLIDLGDFYIEAPGFMGGGAEKAASVAAQLDALDPSAAAQLRGRIAEAHKDYGTAEREFRHAVAVALHPAVRWATLASFLERRQRWDEMETAVRSCDGAAQRDSRATVALYDCAGVLIDARRDPQAAAKMLEEYLSSSSKTDEAPAFEALVRLAKLEDDLGDTAAAKRDRSAALALAHEYSAAQETRRH
jgi:tetratricopeptide (TPR) repeat protein